MKEYKNINEILKDWGKGKEKIPANNEVLKSEILSKVPAQEFRMHTTRRRTFAPWLSMGFAVIAVIVFIGSGLPHYRYSGGGVASNIGGSMPIYTQEKSADSSVAYNPVYPGYDHGYDAPITDTREFLKTYYNANLRTRDVLEAGAKVELFVRGSGGRIDSASLEGKYGNIRFAIPSDKFIAFRDQVQHLVLGKLFTENVSSENLLPQKQFIEDRQSEANTRLAYLKREQSELVKNHLEAERNLPENERAAENVSYDNNFAKLERQMQQARNEISSLKKEDKDFTANIYTVNGSISLEKISLWGIADIYTPGPLLAWLFALAAVAIYWRYRVISRIYLVPL